MGYAQLSQKGEGIHLRQFSRAFIIEDEQENRVAFVSFDAGMVGNAVKRAVIKKLKERYGAMYTTENVIVSGTHTHSAPGGFLTHLLYDLSTLGFVSETFNAYVDGIYNVSLNYSFTLSLFQFIPLLSRASSEPTTIWRTGDCSLQKLRSMTPISTAVQMRT